MKNLFSIILLGDCCVSFAVFFFELWKT